MCIRLEKARGTVQIHENKVIAKDTYELVFIDKTLASKIKPGQFVNLYCYCSSRLLPRPISICEVDKKQGWIKLIYAVVGEGTKEFSKLNQGDSIEVLGPLGNGFTMENSKSNLIIGGGVGVPPLLELAKQLQGNNRIILGFRQEPFLVKEFEQYGEVFVATDTGNYGYKGTVIDVLNHFDLKGNSLYSCGPKPMLKAVKEWAQIRGISAQFSLEERMGCGFGACVGCAVKVWKNKHEFSYKKVCMDGPVFRGDEIFND